MKIAVGLLIAVVAAAANVGIVLLAAWLWERICP